MFFRAATEMAVIEEDEEESEESVRMPDYVGGVNLPLQGKRKIKQNNSNILKLSYARTKRTRARLLVLCWRWYVRDKSNMTIFCLECLAHSEQGKRENLRVSLFLSKNIVLKMQRICSTRFLSFSILNSHMLTFVLRQHQRLGPNTTDKLLSVDMWMPWFSAAHPSSVAVIVRSHKHKSPLWARI